MSATPPQSSQPTTIRSGRCACEEVRFEGVMEHDVLHCHCTNCRHITGNFIAAIHVATNALIVKDPKSRLRWFDLGYARYGFCSNCGATLFWQATETPEITSVTTGTLDDASGLRLAGVWYGDEAQNHQVLPTAVPHFHGNASQ